MAAVNTLYQEKKLNIDDTDYGAPESFTFDPVEHVYTLGGKPLNGVTTILGVIAKPMLIQWAADMACDHVLKEIKPMLEDDEDGAGYLMDGIEEIIKEARTAHRKKKEKAGELGTEVHAMIEAYIKSLIEENDGYADETVLEAFEKDPIKNKQVKNFLEWAVENKVKFLGSEVRMFSKEMWTAGTADIICEIDGKLYVGDIKTSSGIYPEAFIQASAYTAMLKEMGICKNFHGVVILNCRKDGGFEYKYNYDLEGNLNCFKAAVTLFRGLNSLKN